MTSILVVCTGNICRSPIAEGFIRNDLVRRLGDRAPVVSSAGTGGWEGSPAMPGSVRAASEREVDISGHAARALTPAMVGSADLIVCMAGEHRDAIIGMDPAAEPKTYTLKELVRLLDRLPPADGDIPDQLADRLDRVGGVRAEGFAGNPLDEDIADPLGQPLEAYRAIAWELDQWSQRLVDGFYGKRTVPSTVGEGE
jgi:low molecular weight protein-tyrosine phosphatase